MGASIPLQPAKALASSNLASSYLRTRQASVDLIASLTPEDCVIQTIPEVSPTKWHLAHTTWFFEQFILLEHCQGYRAWNDKFLYLFNSYYHSVGKMHARPERGLLNRPTLAEVLDYREQVDAAMLGLLETAGNDQALAFLVALGLQHEQQHQELMLTDIKHVFFTNPLQPEYAAAPNRLPVESEAMQFVEQSGGRYRIGFDDEGFCFDNETPRHDVLVDAYALADRPVSNGEFRDFIDDGGYNDVRLWMSDGWALVQTEGWNRPLYWSEGRDREFTLGGWQPLNDAAPVCHVSQYEADAYARWARARLPTEAEWELAAVATTIEGNTLDTGLLHPAPAGTQQAPLRQLWGDVWEWTASPYSPYPRFKPLAGSLGEYNGKFMSNQIVVRGGSCASWRDHLRPTYRSFFYPQDRWQFLGFRLAQTTDS